MSRTACLAVHKKGTQFGICANDVLHDPHNSAYKSKWHGGTRRTPNDLFIQEVVLLLVLSFTAFSTFESGFAFSPRFTSPLFPSRHLIKSLAKYSWFVPIRSNHVSQVVACDYHLGAIIYGIHFRAQRRLICELNNILSTK